MSLIKKLRNKIIEKYHSNKSYKGLLAFWFIPLLIGLAFLLIKGIFETFSGENDGGVFVILIIIIIIGCFSLVLKGIVDSIFLPSQKIEENMKELPKNVGSEKILVQYDLSKEISPSEAGIMMYKKAEISNLLCVVYKWIRERKVDIQIKDGNKYLVSIDNLGKDADEYESYLFYSIFNYIGQSVKFNKNLLRKYKLKVNDMIFKLCQSKGYFEEGEIGDYIVVNEDGSEQKVYNLGGSLSVGCFLAFLFVSGIISLCAGNLYFGLSCGVLVILVICNSRWNKVYEQKLTDKGKKMLAEIIGYKYYLENCEEEQINSDLEENEVYSKHLPYAIALKLNWKIINELC